MELPNDALINFIYPNNAHIVWSLMIVIYPFITGLIAGAFAVSALHHVFKLNAFKELSNFSLVAAFCFGLFAGIPLLVHLGQPQRAFNIFFTPHLTSAMSIFGYVYGGYMILLSIEIWLIYRPFFIRRANETTGLQKFIWSALTLWVSEYNPESAKVDHKLSTLLAGIGIPWAFVLHGYVGFVFGSVKAIPWWATALQPIIFLSSAMVSGISMILVLYVFITWRRKLPYDFPLIKKFAGFLFGIFLLDWSLEMLELIHVSYMKGYEWAEIGPLITQPLFIPYVILQIIVLSLIPSLMLGWAVITSIGGRKMMYLTVGGGIGLIFQVLVMRFNVVIGGQMISKSGRGYVEFNWDLFGKEGVLVAIVILAAPFIVYNIVSRVIPTLGDPRAPEGSLNHMRGDTEAS